MRFSSGHTRVAFAPAVLVTLCLMAFSVQAFDQPPLQIPTEPQSKPVEISLALEVPPALPEAGSSKVSLHSDPARRAIVGRTPASAGGEDVCHNESTGNCDSGQLGLNGAHHCQCNEDDCWEIDGDGVCDPLEDRDGDGICDMTDCAWNGLAFPFDTGGGAVDTVSFQVNTNRGGGDIYITGDAGCQPDVLNILAKLCCTMSGLETGVSHDVHFDPVQTSADEPTWVLFLQRSGHTGTDALGFPNGSHFPDYQVARNAEEPSALNRAFINVSGTGNPGGWIDLDWHGGLGTTYCVDLSFTEQDPGGPYDCIANPEPTGACCDADGNDCEEIRSFDCGASGGVYLGDGTTCDACFPACNAGAGGCCEPHDTPGCRDDMCCYFVCLQDPFCCHGSWGQSCAELANDPQVGCGQVGEECDATPCFVDQAYPTPACIQTGPDLEQDGALGVVPDEYGAWASYNWSGGQEGGCEFGDKFKPVGFDAMEAVFGNALFVYYPDPGGDADLDRRAICSGVPNHEGTYPIDVGPAALFPEIPTEGAGVLSDTNDDGVDDTLTSQFILCEALSDIALQFDVVQHVERVASEGGQGVGVLTQTYTITNTSESHAAFNWIRQVDSSLQWIGDDRDDAVGTMTHADGGDLSVYTMEHQRPTTAVTLSSPQAAFYYGGKGDFDPDDVGECVDGTCLGGPHDGEACDPLNCPDDTNADVPECVCSGGPIYGCGTDFQQWHGFGLPEGWANHVANVGYNIDGDSGGSPVGCDGSSFGCSCDAGIGLVIPVTLEPGESTCVCIQHTYGQRTPWMGGTCPEGCDIGCGQCPTDTNNDGDTSAFDLAILLGAWGPVTLGSYCIDADQNGIIDAFDLAVLLANWGPCE